MLQGRRDRIENLQEVRHGLDLRASGSSTERPRVLIRKHRPSRSNPHVKNIQQLDSLLVEELASNWTESRGLRRFHRTFDLRHCAYSQIPKDKGKSFYDRKQLTKRDDEANDQRLVWR